MIMSGRAGVCVVAPAGAGGKLVTSSRQPAARARDALLHAHARAALAMSALGIVAQKDNQLFAKIATYDLGKRYQFAGPLRGDDERLAYQDLCYIPYRPQANGGAQKC